MKKILAAILSLLMLFSCISALAEPFSIAMLEKGAYWYIPNLAGGGDTLYFHMQSGDGGYLYRWQTGMEAPELLSDEILGDVYYTSLEDAFQQTGKDFTYAISALFMRGESLLALNEINGLVFEIKKEGDSIAYTDVLTLDLSEYQKLKENYASILQAIVADNTLYLLYRKHEYSDNDFFLDAFDLQTGARARINVPFINDIAPHKDGKLLATIYDEMNAYNDETGVVSYAKVFILDPRSGALEKVLDGDKDFMGGSQYDAGTNSLYFQNRFGVMIMPDMGAPVQAAYATVDNYSTPKTLLLNGGLYAFSDNNIIVKSTNPAELPNTVLYATYIGGQKALSAFEKQNPGVPVLMAGYQGDLAEITTALLAKDSSVDVYEGYPSSGLDRIIDKGFALDISKSKILMDTMAQMPAAVQEICMRDGKLYAFPTTVYAPAFCLEMYSFQDIELNPEEFPTNFIDLLKFIGEWDETYADLYPDVIPMDCGKETFLYFLQNEYIAYYSYLNEPLTFDTDLFRSLLGALDACDFSFIEDLGEALWEKRTLVVDYGNPLTGNSKRLGMSLSANTPYVATMHLNCLFVNINTKNPDLAISLLENTVLDYDPETRVVLFPHSDEVFESPHFQKTMEDFEKQLASQKERLETADPDMKRDIEQEITWLEEALSNPDRFRYDISPDVVAQYREMVTDNLVVNTESILYASEDAGVEVQALMERYLQGQMPAEGYIQGIEKILKRIMNEQK